MGKNKNKNQTESNEPEEEVEEGEEGNQGVSLGEGEEDSGEEGTVHDPEAEEQAAPPPKAAPKAPRNRGGDGTRYRVKQDFGIDKPGADGKPNHQRYGTGQILNAADIEHIGSAFQKRMINGFIEIAEEEV